MYVLQLGLWEWAAGKWLYCSALAVSLVTNFFLAFSFMILSSTVIALNYVFCIIDYHLLRYWHFVYYLQSLHIVHFVTTLLKKFLTMKKNACPRYLDAKKNTCKEIFFSYLQNIQQEHFSSSFLKSYSFIYRYI